MANKLLKPKRGRVENLPKLAVEDGSLIFAYDTKSPTSTVLVDVGETRYELSAATAKKADDSNALGGSSLQNIVDKINNSTGDGTAFTDLDTTTNNKVKLTRANGSIVEKIINNVSNASTADYAKSADGVIDYNEPTRHIKIGYAGAGLSTSNLNYIAGYTNNGTQIKDVSKDVLKNWLGTMGSADSAKVIEPFENATANASRNVWFSDSEKRNKPVYNDNFKYNPVSQILTTNISGSAENATTARYLFQANEGGAAGKNGWVKAISIQIKAWYCDSPLMFAITQRGRSGPTFLYVYFLNVDSADPSLGTFSYSGSPITAKIIKSATSIWDIWIYKTEGYDSIGVMMAQYDFPYIGPRVVITYPDVFSESDPGTGTSPFPFGNVSHSVNSDALGGSSLSQVLASAGSDKFLPLAGGTMTGTITAAIGNQKGIKIGNQWITSANDTNGEVVLQGGHLRFGTTAWDYNQWAGLKYDHNKKYIYLGLADGTIFTANSAQSGGSLLTPGISNIYVGGTTQTRVITSSDIDGYVKKSGDTMTGALNFANNIWNKVGDDVKIGDHNIAGSLGVIGVNGQTRIDWCQYDNASKYQGIVYDGIKLATSGTFKADYFEGTIANATSAKNASHLGGKPSSDYALKADLSGDINALSAKRLPSYQSISVANSFFYRYGTAGNTSDGGAWTGFPSTTLYSEASTANGFGSALFQKKVGVLHLAAGSSAHDLVFQAGGTNDGIAYVATGRNPAYILDTLNYKDKAYTFNKLTASSTFTATSGVVIDGGSY